MSVVIGVGLRQAGNPHGNRVYALEISSVAGIRAFMIMLCEVSSEPVCNCCEP
jgi:hypothetical protein